MSNKYESQNLCSYLELGRQQEELFFKLAPLAELERELTPSEEWAFGKLCEEIDDVCFKMRCFLNGFLDETDKIITYSNE